MLKSWMNEFKKFALKGNVIDMAVGIIIGAAFGKIVDSLVKDILMPPIGLLMGAVDFSNLFFVLREGAKPGPYLSPDEAVSSGAVILNLGAFLNALISFLIVAFAVFLLIKTINGIREKIDKNAVKAAKQKECPYCRLMIPAQAVRCPHCTSDLSDENLK